MATQNLYTLSTAVFLRHTILNSGSVSISLLPPIQLIINFLNINFRKYVQKIDVLPMSTFVNNSCYKDIQTLEGHASAFESNTPSSKRIEYILEWNLLEKSVKRPFSCFVFILQVYFTYLFYVTFWALGHHFIEKLRLILKENQIMKQTGFIIDQ